MSRKTRIAFVGAGAMGQCAHLRNYATIPECEVVALAELRPELGRRVAARYGVGRVYADAAQMIENEAIDGIVASQPFDRHGRILPELYRTGIPVFTEKPLASSIPTAQALLSRLAESGSWHMVGYHKRCDPATMWVKQQIDRLKTSGELGRLTYVRILIPAGDWVASGFTDLIRSDEPYPDIPADPSPADTDEGAYRDYLAFVNYYIHQVNLMRHLLGEPYRVTYADPSGILLALTSESGVAGTIEMSPYTTSVDWQESALICFEHGTLTLDLPAPLASHRPGRAALFSDPGSGVTPQVLQPQLPWIHAMRQQAITFVRAIRGEAEPPCQAAEALEDLKIAQDYLTLRKGALRA